MISYDDYQRLFAQPLRDAMRQQAPRANENDENDENAPEAPRATRPVNEAPRALRPINDAERLGGVAQMRGADGSVRPASLDSIIAGTAQIVPRQQDVEWVRFDNVLAAAASVATPEVSPLESDLPPRSRLVPSCQIPVYVGERASSTTRAGLDSCNEAPRSLVSYDYYEHHLRPQGYKIEAVPTGDFPFAACNGGELKPLGVVRDVPFYFKKPGAGESAVYRLHLYIMSPASNFQNELLLCVYDLKNLRVTLDIGEGIVTFKGLSPPVKVKLSTTQRPPEPGASTIPTTSSVMAATAAATFNFGRPKYLQPRSSGMIKTAVPKLDTEYVFSTSGPSPIAPGLIPAATDTVRLRYDNATDEHICLPEELPVLLTAPETAHVHQAAIRPKPTARAGRVIRAATAIDRNALASFRRRENPRPRRNRFAGCLHAAVDQCAGAGASSERRDLARAPRRGRVAPEPSRHGADAWRLAGLPAVQRRRAGRVASAVCRRRLGPQDAIARCPVGTVRELGHPYDVTGLAGRL
ncbi:MAG: hypothetical protein AAFR38_14975, partial [Planctomycetota bacterium]